MNDLSFKILANCTNKTYNSLVEVYGKTTIDSLISLGYIAVLANGNVVRTELGLNLSKPMNTTNENFGKDGYQLIVDSNNSKGELILS